MTEHREHPGLAPGVSASVQHTVAPGDCADAFGSGSLNVLATPRLIALLEQAALTAAAPYLKPGETTVGTRVDVEHLAACLPGTEVTATAELVSVEGRRLRFGVSAAAGPHLIGGGEHERAIVEAERFLAKLAQGR